MAAVGEGVEEFDRECYQLSFLVFFPKNNRPLLNVTYSLPELRYDLS